MRQVFSAGFRRRTIVVSLAVVLSCAAAAFAATAGRQPAQPRLSVVGVAQDPCGQRALPVPAKVAGAFYPDSSVLRTAAGLFVPPGRFVPMTKSYSACVAAADQAARAWLRAGLVPGSTPAQRKIATRALLDLRLAVQQNGAVISGWASSWRYVWPRDASWVAVALADTGHSALAYQILRFLQRVQSANGTWAARYFPDGSGPVRDGRPAELDAVGWVPWAVWSWLAAQPAGPAGQRRQRLAVLWPMVVRAADAAARSLTSDGLPEPAMDYWEDSVAVTLGTAGPLLAGLRAAADIAAGMGGEAAAADRSRWAAAASRLGRAITAAFGRDDYQRTPSARSGADAAITFLGPPFAVADARLLSAARTAQRALTLPNGGLRPGTRWAGTPDVAWTAETAWFALFDAATGQHRQAAALLSWLSAHRTRLGSLPEQVTATGKPASVAPLSWTDAVVLLAMLAQTGHLSSIPASAVAG